MGKRLYMTQGEMVRSNLRMKDIKRSKNLQAIPTWQEEIGIFLFLNKHSCASIGNKGRRCSDWIGEYRLCRFYLALGNSLLVLFKNPISHSDHQGRRFFV